MNQIGTSDKILTELDPNVLPTEIYIMLIRKENLPAIGIKSQAFSEILQDREFEEDYMLNTHWI
ncbi:hypothetical protein H5410_022534 [Solanum commersonii]|uniref:Uncharacterized protein n=1 Tax=Solanum commersonii TaxID=4109 RepID=A0A9J5ZFQ1_SOLCO|nr:hypothetical protein H5410_022534 [Solanum commersonii]